MDLSNACDTINYEFLGENLMLEDLLKKHSN